MIFKSYSSSGLFRRLKYSSNSFGLSKHKSCFGNIYRDKCLIFIWWTLVDSSCFKLFRDKSKSFTKHDYIMNLQPYVICR